MDDLEEDKQQIEATLYDPRLHLSPLLPETKTMLFADNEGNEMDTRDRGSMNFSSVSELYDMVKSGDDLQLVDVRETSEYESEKIKGAVVLFCVKTFFSA